MGATAKQGKAKKNWVKIVIPVVVVLGLGGAAFWYFYWAPRSAAVVTTTETAYNTSLVRRGSIIISASGSGTLSAGQTASLAFSTSGTVAELNVKVGDQVQEGDTLAVLEDLSSLEADVSAAKLDLQTAEDALDDLYDNSSSALATAETAVLDAEDAVEEAQYNELETWMTPCTQDTINAYYDEWLDAKEDYENAVNGYVEPDPRYYQNRIEPAKENMDEIWANYEACLKYSDYDIETSQNDVTIAQVALDEAKETLQTLQENNGLDPAEVAAAENTVAIAQAAYDKAVETLDGATMTAPFSGTVYSVAGEAGDSVGTDTFITLIDMSALNVSFSLDESDLDKLAVGKAAEIVFDAFPDDTYTGTVSEVTPGLNSSSGFGVLTGVAAVDMSSGDTSKLIDGLNCSVEIISGETSNALLVPVEAVHDLGDGTYAVFVDNGELTMTVVEVGLMDDTYAEIKSGLEQGQTVSTGEVETE